MTQVQKSNNDANADELAKMLDAASPQGMEAFDHDATMPREEENGMRLRTVIVPKDAIPGRSPEWIGDQLAGKPVGTIVEVADIAGWVVSTERRVVEWQGKRLESVWLKGLIQMTALHTGEIFEAAAVILPKAAGEAIDAIFQMAGDQQPRIRVELDMTLGLEKTGKAIPYEWVPISHARGRAQRVVSEMRQKQMARRLAREGGPVMDASASIEAPADIKRIGKRKDPSHAA